MNRTINSILLTIAALFVGVGSANAQLDLKNDLSGATVNWYVSTAAPTASAYGNAATEGTTKVNAGQYVVVKVTPAAGKWTYPEMLTIQTVGGSSSAQARTRGIDLPQSLTKLGTIQADGAGLYYYRIPDDCTPANGYTKVVLDGTLFDKIDLSTATIDGTGKTVTATTGDWTATITLDQVSWTYDGAAHTPAISSFSLTNGTKTYKYTADHVSISGSGTNVGNFNATLSAVATGCLTGTYNATVTITPIAAVVTITGHYNTSVYDGTEHSVSGYDVEISNPLYKETDFTFNGTATAKRTGTGMTTMGLNADQFTNDNANFASVTFNVTDGYQTIISPDVVIVKITGHSNTADYDGKEHNVSGYEVEINNPLYKETDFTFSGTDKAARTDAGTTTMGLDDSQFTNTNTNFSAVIFNVIDGYQTISPIAATVTITGHYNISTYDSKEHSVSGYDVTFSNDLYKETDFTFNGTAMAARTDEGTTNMGLAEDQFTNTSPNFGPVSFTVTDGYQTITSVTDVVVTITGHSNTTDYDGTEHSVSGYDVEISNPLYTEADFTFSGKAAAKRTDAGTTTLGLDDSQFTNTNMNFGTVIFNVTDGYQTISPIAATVTIMGHSNMAVYDGTEHSVTGYDVTFSNDLYKQTDFTFNGTASAAQTYKGTAYMGLSEGQFANTSPNFSTVTFNVTDGYQTITPRPLTVTANDQTIDYGSSIAKGLGQVTAEGLQGSDKLTAITLTPSTTDVTTTGSITPSDATVKNGDNDVTANYDITYSPGTLTINVSDAASAVVTANDRTYDGTAQDLVTIGAITHGATWTAADVVFYESATSTTPLTAVPQGTNAGSYDVYYEVTPDVNHTAPARTKVTVTISQKELTIVADEKSKTYGDPDPALTYAYDGLVGTDKIDGGLSRLSGENVGTYFITQGSLTAGDNYSITYKRNILTINKAEVDVTITGHKNSAPYDGKNHSVNGYDVGISNPLYNVTDFTFNATAEVNRTDVGTTNMGMKSDMFVNNNQNFEVTFKVDTDGYQEIVPINVTVTITGHHDVSTYDNKEHTVSGYDVEFSNEVYTKNDFTFNGTAEAKRTEVGTTYMGLTADKFANTNKNFKTVTFDVTDGYQTITSVTDVVVTITGHNNATDYDGKNHSVSGYDVEISNPLYKESDFAFSGKAEASRTNVGKSDMGLAAEQFANTNPDFTNVIFNVTDGYQEIIAINVVATITGQHDEVIYDGTEHVAEGYTVEFSHPVCTEADIAFSGTDVASRIDVGTVNMGLAAEQFANVNNNFESVLFRVTDGYQTITKKRAVINVTVTSKTYDGTKDAEVSATILGLVSGEKATVEVSGSFEDAEPGINKKVTLSVEVVWDSAKATNYEVDIPTEARGSIFGRRNSGIEVIRNDNGEPVANDAFLTEMSDGTLRIDQISIISPDAVNGIAGGVSIYLPAILTNHNGTTGPICGVASDIIKTDANVSVTDIYMPDTEKPIDVAKRAFRLVDDESTTARIHTSLPLLADYALMPGLKAEYEAGNVMGVDAITTTTQYWTFSSGVDVVVPEGVTAYTCQTDGPDAVAAIAITETKAVVDGKERVIVKANNGVMMGCDSEKGGTFDIIAWPSADRPSGMTPATEDARTYEGNMLVPVIVETHFEPSEYYILYNNAFHKLEPGDDTSVPPGKAVLRKSSPNMSRILSIHDESVGIRSVYDDSRVGEGEWYSLDGRRLNGKPTAKGLYIHNGKKSFIK